MYEKDILIADLRFEIKLLKDKVKAFESGEKYIRMKEEFKKARAADARTIKRLENELEQARNECIHVRDLWLEIIEDLEKELKKLDKKFQKDHKEKLEKIREVYDVRTKLEESEEKVKKLQAKLKKDYTNSSKSSSMSPNHATIHNSREKSGKKPGAQSGHEHHGRKMHEANKKITLETPEEYLDEDKYIKTGRQIHKQLVSVHISTEVIEFIADEYRNKKTGQRIHAPFPNDLVDDVTYDSSVKALAYMINNGLYTSVDKTREFLKEITHGNLDLSNGFICGLSKEFSKKTQEERDEIFKRLVSSSTMHSDFTFTRVNGGQGTVIICSSGGDVLYQGREKKGDEGVKDSPLEVYDGTTITDHESALIKRGNKHQECLAHVLRYAKSSIELEPNLKWNKRLADWIGRATQYWNDVAGGVIKVSKKENDKYISELREILDIAKDEYEYEPPIYFKDGFNLYKRMYECFDDYVLFLRDQNVEPTNNEAERYGRKLKRKGAQVMAFRTQEGLNNFCDGLSIMESVRGKGENLYDEIKERFGKPLITV